MKIDTSYQQKMFIKNKITPILNFINSRGRKEFNFLDDLIRENGEFKNFIGIDCTYDKKNKKIDLVLFWGKYDKLNNEEDYYNLIDSSENELVLNLTKKELILNNVLEKVNEIFIEKINS